MVYFQTKNNEREREIRYISVEAPSSENKSERHRISWDQLISYLESDTHKIKPNILKLLKHMKKDIKESGNINPYQRK